ncbi:unnamed protein product [Prorocentrum cordatum]|uniref:alpha-amylase n=1 Tax=Prorocentrum cordatum TaxID=2364126 RepID=A0ABN9V4K5_9DINO|nr:unnamed protein product [Polarella glacialis]
MASKMHLDGIDQILEAVGCEVDEGRETSAVSKWLLQTTLGMHRIHWVVACGYVMAPLGEVLTFTMASEWGLRSQSSWIPGWFPGNVKAAVDGPMDPSLLRLVLFCTNALAMCIGLPWWAWLCKKTEPRWALAGAMLGQLLLLVGFLPVPPNVYGAVALMFLHGFIAGASMLFVVFNFMMSIRADVSQAALRMGRMETVRYCVSWLATAFVYLASPDGVPGTKEDPLPARVLLLAAPLGIGVAFSAGAAGALCLFAPRPYREDRFPAWDLGLIFHKRSFVCLALSECIGSLMAFPSLSYASWWLDNGWQAEELAEVSAVLAVVLAVGVMLWAKALSLASVHGFSLLISVTVFLLPPSLLAAFCQMEVSSFEYRGRSYGAMVVCAFTLLLQGMQSSAIWAAKIRILGSRWRLLSYCTVTLCASQFCTFLSPIVCEYIARQYSVSFLTRNQEELATAVTACVVPLGVAQYVAQLAASPFIHGDMGSARHRLREATCCSNVCRPRSFAARPPILLAAAIGGGLLAWLAQTAYLWLDAPLPFHPVRRCHQLPEQWVGAGCHQLATRSHADFGLNEFGQSTTAKLRCHQMMKKESGDTFELRDVGTGVGTCRVLACASKERLVQADGGLVRGDRDVYSRYCSLFGQNLVVVHLFEWRWPDIAKECTTYLGPAGFDAVQVSPPFEHVLGSPWFTRYQPVSYKLESRSGTEEEFIDMVRICRDAGVSIMVDAVINHMASKVMVWPESNNSDEPFKCNNSEKLGSNLQCRGWDGTQFGDRHFWDGGTSYKPEEFHHYAGNVRSNCALPPWTNNRHLCDLQGLPDLDTEQKNVREKLTGLLTRLYEIGVTMLRIDAAMLIYPESTGQILEPIPWDYVVQEYYPDKLQVERRTLTDAVDISALTNFKYGWTLATILFDSFDEESDGWIRRHQLGELLDLNSDRSEFPDKPLPVAHGLQFLDNHDQQRERWKACQNLGDTGCRSLHVNGSVCEDPEDGKCRPIYKNGAIYHMAMVFSLAWPFGDSFRIMSSFAWTFFREGPPGTRRNASKDMADSVWVTGDVSSPSRCRARPETTPASLTYDLNTDRPWVCEHRWEGVPGLVRVRKQLGSVCGGDWRGCHVRSRDSWDDFASFVVAERSGDSALAFVALSRGFNHVTQLGSNQSWILAEWRTNATLPPGEYCNLASVRGPVAQALEPRWPANCKESVRVGPEGLFTQGVVRSGSSVVIHKLYRRDLALSPERKRDGNEEVLIT